MKKLIWILLAAFMLSFASCNKCSKKEIAVDSVKAELVVETTISTDKEYMFANYGGDYKWYETCITLKNYLDEDSLNKVEEITNIFQVETEKEGGYDVEVIISDHTINTSGIEVVKGFWIEDFPIDSVKITFAEALDKINQVNYPKPHGKHCVLRKEVGKKKANPQYVFGNQNAQLYVDAVTGDVSDKNPVFPE